MSGDTQHPDAAADPTARRRSALYAGIGAAVGMAGGLVGGAITGDPTYWTGAGIAIGAGTGVAVASNGWTGRQRQVDEVPPG